jgi:hypothetical protein
MTSTAAAPGSRQAHREASERDKRSRRFLLRLSLANWGIAVVAWTVSAFLGITSPASIIVYSVLFVIGLVAVVVALLTYVLEKFAHTPPDYEHADLEAGGDQGDAGTADEDDEALAVAAVATAAPADNVPAKDGPAKSAPVKDGAAKGDAPKIESAPKGDAPGSAPSAKREPAPKGDAPKGDVAKGGAPKSEPAPKGDSAAKGDTPAAPAG